MHLEDHWNALGAITWQIFLKDRTDREIDNVDLYSTSS